MSNSNNKSKVSDNPTDRGVNNVNDTYLDQQMPSENKVASISKTDEEQTQASRTTNKNSEVDLMNATNKLENISLQSVETSAVLKSEEVALAGKDIPASTTTTDMGGSKEQINLAISQNKDNAGVIKSETNIQQKTSLVQNQMSIAAGECKINSVEFTKDLKNLIEQSNAKKYETIKKYIFTLIEELHKTKLSKNDVEELSDKAKASLIEQVVQASLDIKKCIDMTALSIDKTSDKNYKNLFSGLGKLDQSIKSHIGNIKIPDYPNDYLKTIDFKQFNSATNKEISHNFNILNNKIDNLNNSLVTIETRISSVEEAIKNIENNSDKTVEINEKILERLIALETTQSLPSKVKEVKEIVDEVLAIAKANQRDKLEFDLEKIEDFDLIKEASTSMKDTISLFEAFALELLQKQGVVEKVSTNIKLDSSIENQLEKKEDESKIDNTND